jgi:hypothetical protein
MTSWLTSDRVDRFILVALSVVTASILAIVGSEMLARQRGAYREAVEKTTGPGMYYSPETLVILFALVLLVVYIQTQLPDDHSEEEHE